MATEPENPSTAVGKILENAEEAPARGDHKLDWKQAQTSAPWFLPGDAPVTALGYTGDNYFYLDAANQLRTLKDTDHVRLKMLGLFGARQTFLYACWPRLNQDKDSKDWFCTGWRPEAAQEALMDACAKKGVWDVAGKIRGVGGWVEDNGDLIFHCGDALWLGPNDVRRAGTLISGGYIYPTGPAIERPAPDPAPVGEDGPGKALLELFEEWNWRRGEIDAILLLGWIGVAMLGAALKWRPAMWITGGKGTGKSTLHDVLRFVIPSILSSPNATAASIWQVLGHKSSPVAIDELEARDDNRRSQAMIELAREAASGGVIYRGGNDHTSVQFTLRSAFLFSSIIIPPLQSQDVSRLAILDLEKLEDITPPPLASDGPALKAIGCAIKRRLADAWPDFQARLECWRAQMEAVGHDGHGPDQFGTLLAVADILLFEDPPDIAREGDGEDRLDVWSGQLTRAALDAQSDDANDEERCLQRIMSTPADVWSGGSKYPIALYIQRVANISDQAKNPVVELQAAIDKLGNIGLRIEPMGEYGELYLCVANDHQGLARLFEGTHWVGKSGTGTQWRQTLLRLPGAELLSEFENAEGKKRKSLRFGGVVCRAVCIPIRVALSEDEDKEVEG